MKASKRLRMGLLAAAAMSQSPIPAIVFAFTAQAQPAQCRMSSARDQYKLAADTVEWQMEIAPGQNCIRGVRTSGALIDHIKVASAPRSGRVTVQGPAFYYYAAPDFRGADSFELVITGRMHGIKGISIVKVLVSVR